MKSFLDSSALAKRYIRERGSDKVRGALAQASEVAIRLICPPEILSALCRIRRRGSISAAHYEEAKNALYADIEDVAICALGPVRFLGSAPTRGRLWIGAARPRRLVAHAIDNP